jgi:hypothetical protein
MPEGVLGFFEPQDTADVEAGAKCGDHLVAKMLIPIKSDILHQVCELFTHRVLIIRDPRDILISFLLYTSASQFAWKYPADRLRACVQVLRQKEEDPGSVSVYHIFEVIRDGFDCNEFSVFISDMLSSAITLNSEEYGFYIFRYEDMIAQSYAGLESYLGFPLFGPGEVDIEYNRVIRTRASGDWMNWFLNDDVKFFRKPMSNFMNIYGYGDDWAMGSERSIYSDHCSSYFVRIVNERRFLEGLELI